MKPIKKSNLIPSAVRSLLLGGATILAAVATTHAANFYWDTDGTTPGFGSLTNENFGTAAYWSTSPTGEAETATYATANAGGTILQSDNLYFGTSAYPYSGTLSVSGSPAKLVTTGNYRFGGNGDIIISSQLEIASTGGNGIRSTSTGTVVLNGRVIGNAGSITQSGSGVLTLSRTNNSYGSSTHGTNVLSRTIISGGGTIRAAFLADSASDSSIGRGGNGDAKYLQFDNGTLVHYGSQASSTNRDFTIGDGGATIKNESTDSAHTVTWTGTAAYDTVDSDRSLTLGGGNTGENTFSGSLADNGTGKLSLTKTDAGKWIITGTGHIFTGSTTISGGTLALGTDGTLPADTDVTIGNGTLELADAVTDAVGTLDVTNANSTIKLGGGSSLAFADSSGVNDGAWTGTLNLVGFVSGSSLNFGSSSGLTAGQLAKISATGFSDFALDAEGDLIATPVGGSKYEIWANGAVFNEDDNKDGVDNGIAFLLGAATTGVDALDRLPEIAENSGNLVLTFDCLNGTDRGDAVLQVEYSKDPGQSGPWAATEVPGVVGTHDAGVVDFEITDPGEPGGPLHVIATIPLSAAEGTGSLFGRVSGVP